MDKDNNSWLEWWEKYWADGLVKSSKIEVVGNYPPNSYGEWLRKKSNINWSDENEFFKEYQNKPYEGWMCECGWTGEDGKMPKECFDLDYLPDRKIPIYRCPKCKRRI